MGMTNVYIPGLEYGRSKMHMETTDLRSGVPSVPVSSRVRDPVQEGNY